MKKISLVLFCILLSIIGKTQTIPTDNQLKTGIDTIVQNVIAPFMNETSRVGVSIGIFNNGRKYTYNYGSVQKGKQGLPTANTVYETGSITKTFTGMFLAEAVLENKVKFEDDIRNYIKGNYPNLEYQGHPITILDLVNHTSGLPYFLPDNPEILNTHDYDTLIFNIEQSQRNYTKQNFFEDLHKVKLDTVPGFKSNYSNSAVQLLGFILENIYKITYEEILQKYISIPLNMNRTGQMRS